MCVPHGHELRRGMLEGMGAPGGGIKERKKEWDNFNSIMNKIYLKSVFKKTKGSTEVVNTNWKGFTLIRSKTMN